MFPTAAADAGLAAIGELSRTVANLEQDVDDSVRVDRIRALEELRSAVAAAQARETAGFVDSQRAAQHAVGVPAERIGRGIAAQVGLARRISPYRASRYVGWAKILTTELPRTYAVLCRGQVPEGRALSVARETVWLSREQRAAVDAELAPRLESLGDRQVETEARKLGYALDPAGYVARLRNVEGDRHVSLRPAPDCMTRLSALLPVKQGVAAYAALTRAADAARGEGDERARGQLMADTLVERVTGQAAADDVPIEINLIMTDEALFNTGEHADEPVDVVAEGVPATTIPAELGRRAAADASGGAAVFLRRLYTRPEDGQLAAMDSRSRFFTGNLRKFLCCATGFAVLPGAVRRSGTPTTSPPPTRADPRPPPTARDCARRATTRSRPTVGRSGSSPPRSSRPHRPDTGTEVAHPDHPAGDRPGHRSNCSSIACSLLPDRAATRVRATHSPTTRRTPPLRRQ